jgi:hypothetical protein
MSMPPSLEAIMATRWVARRDVVVLPEVGSADSGPLGNYTLQATSDAMGLHGNVIPFNKSSGMYLTGAQQFSVAAVPLFAGGEPLPVYVGQRFGSADDGLKCHDYQYLAPLHVSPTGVVAEMAWVNDFTVEIGVPVS